MIPEMIVVLTVYGCGDQSQSCDYIPQSELILSSHAECDAAIPAAIEQYKTEPYPVITASCEPKYISAAAPENSVFSEAVGSTPGEPESQNTFYSLRDKVEQTDSDFMGRLRKSMQRTGKRVGEMVDGIRDLFKSD